MKFKLLIVMTQDELTDKAIEAARSKGATGCTVITGARGEGLAPQKSFLGLTVGGQRDVVLFLIEEHNSREVLETIATTCSFDKTPGAGVIFQIDIEDAIGMKAQMQSIMQKISKEDL
jgi:nitrogen regulatory protein PII